MNDSIVSESYNAINSNQLQKLFQTMSEVGYSDEDVEKFCTRPQVLNLFKVVRGYSALTILKPFEQSELSGENPTSSELMTKERCQKLHGLFTKFKFTESDISAVCERSLLREMLFLVREQAVLTRLVHVIDCAAENYHDNFMGCRGAKHTHEMEVLVWSNPPNLGRFEVIQLNRKTSYLRLFDFNVKVCDYLLENADLIPETWKQYWKVDFNATRTYSRGFMMGRPTHSTPGLTWNKKLEKWVRFSK